MNNINESNIIDLSYEKDDIQDAKDWSEENEIIIILPKDTAEELDEDWDRWQQMSDSQQDDSNSKSMELFGINNYDHYIGLKNKLYGNLYPTNQEDSDYDQYISSDDSISLEFTNKLPDISEKNKKIHSILNEEIFHTSNPNKLLLASSLMNIINESNNYFEKAVNDFYINHTKNSMIESKLLNYSTSYSFFSTEEMDSLGVYKLGRDNYYNESADNKFIDKDNKITTKMWFEDYKLACKGFITENTAKYNNIRTLRLLELYEDYYNIKDIKKLNARKQSILELGWNPEILYNVDNRIKANKHMSDLIESEYSKINIIDLQSLTENLNSDNVITESVKDDILYPIYILISFTYTIAGKVISKVTNSTYTHAAFSLDPNLNKLYSFNMNVNGFSLEDIKNYTKHSDQARMALYTIFVKKKDLDKIKLKLDYFLNNIKNTSYSVLNLFTILFNKPVQMANSMVCSQFVDFLLKYIDIDITGKVSALVAPQDFSKINNPKLYKVYEGLIKDYDSNKVSILINKLRTKARYIKEEVEIINESQFNELLLGNYDNLDSLLYLNENVNILSESNRKLYDEYIKPYIEVEPFCEAKEFPIQFDKEGNLLIKTMKRIDFESEYAKSHKLLVTYEKDNNIEGISYELSKLWFMNTLLENKIYNEKHSDEELQSYHKARAKILNDFKKYIKIITQQDKDFNFTEYYESSPFSNSSIKINKSTIKYSGETLGAILKSLL